MKKTTAKNFAERFRKLGEYIEEGKDFEGFDTLLDELLEIMNSWDSASVETSPFTPEEAAKAEQAWKFHAEGQAYICGCTYEAIVRKTPPSSFSRGWAAAIQHVEMCREARSATTIRPSEAPLICQEDGRDADYNQVEPACDQPATHYSCTLLGGRVDQLNACAKHKCRCKQSPAPRTNEAPIRIGDRALIEVIVDAIHDDGTTTVLVNDPPGDPYRKRVNSLVLARSPRTNEEQCPGCRACS